MLRRGRRRPFRHATAQGVKRAGWGQPWQPNCQAAMAMELMSTAVSRTASLFAAPYTSIGHGLGRSLVTPSTSAAVNSPGRWKCNGDAQ